MERNVIIHGHFYQPPRKNPWSGLLGKQAGASPADNWNERILNECYMPNTEARINESETANNYELISFNMGPTLSGWMAENYIDIYKKIISADNLSGGAAALPYNHTILPLDNEFIRKIQISWGIQHFELNYSRQPEGMWLPECAVNYDVIDDLVKAGIKYIFLTPGQAEAIKRINGYHWYDVSDGSIDVRRPYRLFSHSGYLDVFFSNQELAVDFSFRKILDNPAGAAEKIEKMFGHKHAENLVLSIVTDGETFGHHHKGAEIGLVKLIKEELPARGIKTVMPSDYIRGRKLECEVKIKNNSSWSCVHGVKRWMEDCGCGTEDGSNLKWRKPLREAIDWLGKTIIDIFVEKSAGFFNIPVLEAASNFGRVISNPSMLSDFHNKFVRDEFRNSITVNKAIELMHFTCYMFTSCGWFFGNLKRLEPAQNISVALRAIEILKDLWGLDLEPEFYAKLNQHEDAKFVWDNMVIKRKKEPYAIAEEFMNIYKFTGIKCDHRGYWQMEIVDKNPSKKIKMQNSKTGEVFEFEIN